LWNPSKKREKGEENVGIVGVADEDVVSGKPGEIEMIDDGDDVGWSG